MTPPPWDFEYAPVQSHALVDPVKAKEMVVATGSTADIGAALKRFDALTIETLIDRAPLHWALVSAPKPLALQEVESELVRAGIDVRYVASARQPSMRLGRALHMRDAEPAHPDSWSLRSQPIASDEDHPHRWFTGDDGVRVQRDVCGFGVGTRLAMIDNDAGRTDALALDALIPIARPEPDRTTLACHGAALVAWAIGHARFAGVAPGASPRLYCIPKAGEEVVAFPLALARAVFDGADVVACATYLEGTTSPMLDDALEVAARLGRDGLGTAVFLAAGREMCSPGGLMPSSLSIDLGDVAADPRAFCIGPSGRGGGWFLYEDRRGELRPFGNRGPSVRFMAPGDDAANPFAPEQLRHTESSGATAFAAGVALLVLSCAPELTLEQLEGLLVVSATRSDPAAEVARVTSARQSELLPRATDRDGHNAKHGYGRLDATTACGAATDPVALLLAASGETTAVRRWMEHERRRALMTPALAQRLSRTLLESEWLRRAGAILVRHVRLISSDTARADAHAPGALLRFVALLLRDLARATNDNPELLGLLERTTCDGGIAFGRAVAALASELWPARGKDVTEAHGAVEHGV